MINGNIEQIPAQSSFQNDSSSLFDLGNFSFGSEMNSDIITENLQDPCSLIRSFEELEDPETIIDDPHNEVTETLPGELRDNNNLTVVKIFCARLTHSSFLTRGGYFFDAQRSTEQLKKQNRLDMKNTRISDQFVVMEKFKNSHKALEMCKYVL